MQSVAQLYSAEWDFESIEIMFYTEYKCLSVEKIRFLDWSYKLFVQYSSFKTVLDEAFYSGYINQVWYTNNPQMHNLSWIETVRYNKHLKSFLQRFQTNLNYFAALLKVEAIDFPFYRLFQQNWNKSIYRASFSAFE